MDKTLTTGAPVSGNQQQNLATESKCPVWAALAVTLTRMQTGGRIS